MENNASHSGTPQMRRPIRRVALACIQCRLRKVKCDATQPLCTRCQVDGKQCEYQKSRRGGRPRRPVPAPLQAAESTPSSETSRQWIEAVSSGTDSNSSVAKSAGSSSQSVSDTLEVLSNLDTVALGGTQLTNIQVDQLLSQYYVYFHVSHPCVLPKWSLRTRIFTDSAALDSLLPVLLYIGSIFTHSIPSEPLAEAALQAINAAGARGSRDPFFIQALTLYSIAVYWCNEPERGRQLLDEAIQSAVAIGMHRAAFATQYGQADPVLEESWRRTWWTIYITDAHIAGSTHSFPTKSGLLQNDVGLPCEEDLYESGVGYHVCPDSSYYSLHLGYTLSSDAM